MRWIAMTNAGSLDVIGCINMLGASVKEHADSIGMFGSGIKFALAQAIRMGITVKISDGENMFTTTVVNKSFRDKSFEMVGLNKNDGEEVIATPLTSEFGAKDWNDKWFIFREFWSNMLDERGNATIVDGECSHIAGHTTVFLPYDDFSSYYENIEDYFRKSTGASIKVGTGRVFRQGVYVGSIDVNIDIESPAVILNECRVANEKSIEKVFDDLLQWSTDSKVWGEVLSSEKSHTLDFYISRFYPKTVQDAMINGLTEKYGNTYCVCPNVIDIIKDVRAMGFTPVPLRHGDMFDFEGLVTYKSLMTNKSVRDLSNSETDEYIKVLTSIAHFIPLAQTQDITVKVITSINSAIQGQADIGKRIIYIRENLFEDRRKLTHVVIHEIGHIISRADDYQRAFINYFVDRLTDMAVK